MYALINKADNGVIRISSVGGSLSNSKPFYWVLCPDEMSVDWTYDGVQFTAPPPPPPPPQPTEAELLAQAIESIRDALQSTIDAKAITFGFSGGNALMLYAGFTNAFQPLAQTFATWEANVWVEAEAYKVQVLAGTAPMLSPNEAILMMPEYPG